MNAPETKLAEPHGGGEPARDAAPAGPDLTALRRAVILPFTPGPERSAKVANGQTTDKSASAWMTALAERGTSRVYPAKTIIMTEGDPGTTVYVIKEGHGKVFSGNGAGKEIILGTFGPGDILGEPSLDGGVRSASVMTLERTTCVIVQMDVVLALIAEQPRLTLDIIHNLIRLVRSSSDSVKSLALEDVYGRVVRLLMKAAEPAAQGWIVHERLTQQSIADRVGSSREMVSRIFKDLERGGYLAVQDKSIAILKKPPPGW